MSLSRSEDNEQMKNRTSTTDKSYNFATLLREFLLGLKDAVSLDPLRKNRSNKSLRPKKKSQKNYNDMVSLVRALRFRFCLEVRE